MAGLMLAHLPPQPPALPPRLTLWVSAAFVMFLYLCFVGGIPFADRVIYDLDETGGGDIVKQLLFITLGLVFAGVLLKQPQVSLKPLITPMLLVTLGWALLSVGWSAVPDIAIRRLILTLIVIFITYASVALLGPRKVLDILFFTLLGLLIISYLGLPVIANAVHNIGERGNDALAGNWRGIFINKNTAGYVCAFIIMMGLQRLWFGVNNQRKLTLAAIILAAVFLFFTASKTSAGLLLPVVMLATASVWFLKKADLNKRKIYLWIGAATALSIMATVYFSGVLEILSDPMTFTGRAAIWSVLGELIADRPLLGYGYASVYGVGMATPLLNYASGWVLLVVHGHNGYLDLMVTVGSIGFLLVIITFIMIPMYKIVMANKIPHDILGIILSLMFFVVFHNMIESTIFDREQAPWVAFVIITAIAQFYAMEKRSI